LSDSLTNAIQNTLFLEQREAKTDDVLVRDIGPQICVFLSRIIKLSQLFAVEHAQTVSACREFAEWLDESMRANSEEFLQLQMTESNYFINGQLIRMDARGYAMTLEVRTTLLGYAINQISFGRGIVPTELLEFVRLLRDVRGAGMLSIQDFRQPHLELANVAEQELDVPETADERRAVIEIYASLLVKTSVYFHRLRRGAHPSSKYIKRLVQQIADRLADQGDIFVGLINLRMVTGQDFVHAANTSIYAMMLADAIRLERMDVVRCGMTALTQDIDRLQVEEETEEVFSTGDETHFRTNLSAVTSMSRIGATDVLSALRLVTSYERGFPFNKPLPTSWYREELRPHLLSRIVEIARHYDIATQGLEGEAKTPDRALQAMMMTMGSHYDPNLMKIFVNVVGIYPVGCVIELSSRERAVVMRSPEVVTEDRISNAVRPIIRMLDGTERIIDLALEQNQGLRIVRIVEEKELSERPGVFFLF
jgi:hypothetical protein